jgi:hypothetical protein
MHLVEPPGPLIETTLQDFVHSVEVDRRRHVNGKEALSCPFKYATTFLESRHKLGDSFRARSWCEGDPICGMPAAPHDTIKNELTVLLDCVHNAM